MATRIDRPADPPSKAVAQDISPADGSRDLPRRLIRASAGVSPASLPPLLRGILLGAAVIAWPIVCPWTAEAADTTWKSYGTNAAVSTGDNNGFETTNGTATPIDGTTSNNSYLRDANSGSSGSPDPAVCFASATNRDQHKFSNFGFSVPAGSAINGITVNLEMKVNALTGAPPPGMCVRLCEDTAGCSAASQFTFSSTGDVVYPLGSQTDAWGVTWSSSHVNNASFRVETTTIAAAANKTFDLDYLEVRVSYGGPRTWDGGGGADTNFSTAANWDSNVAIATGDDLIFPSGGGNAKWDASAPATLTSITANSGYANTMTLDQTGVTVTGDIILNGGTFDMTTKNMTAQGNITPNTGTTFKGTWIGGGTLFLSGGTASVTIGGAGTTELPSLDIASGKTVTLAGNVLVQLGLARNGALNLSSYELRMYDDAMTGTGTFTAGTGSTFWQCQWNAPGFPPSLPALTYYHLKFTNCFTEGLDRQANIADGTVVNGDLTVSGAKIRVIASAPSFPFFKGAVNVGSGTAIGQLDLLSSSPTIKGNLTITQNATFTKSSGTLTFGGSGTSTITDSTSAGPQDLGAVTINGTTKTINLGSSVKATSVTIAASQTLSDNGANTLTATTVTVNGTLSMTNSGSKLKIAGNGTLTMNAGGIINISDVAIPVELTTSDAVTPTYVGVNLTGGTLNVAELSVDYLKSTGFVIGSGVTLTAFDKVTWGGNGQTSGGTDVILDITSLTKNLLNHVFPSSWGGEVNVRANTSGTMTMWDWSGGFGGENNDCDTGGEVLWKGGPGSGPQGSGAVGAPLIY